MGILKNFLLVLCLYLGSGQAISSVDANLYKKVEKEFIDIETWASIGDGPFFDLDIKVGWEDDSIGAYASNPIYLSGGLLAYEYMDVDTLVLTICHEFGHGYPVLNYYFRDVNFGWGHLFQDYYAANICLKAFLTGSKLFSHRELKRSELKKIPDELVVKCKKNLVMIKQIIV